MGCVIATGPTPAERRKMEREQKRQERERQNKERRATSRLKDLTGTIDDWAKTYKLEYFQIPTEPVKEDQEAAAKDGGKLRLSETQSQLAHKCRKLEYLARNVKNAITDGLVRIDVEIPGRAEAAKRVAEYVEHCVREARVLYDKWAFNPAIDNWTREYRCLVAINAVLFDLAQVGGGPGESLTAKHKPHPILEEPEFKGLTMDAVKERHAKTDSEATEKVKKLDEDYKAKDAKYRAAVLSDVQAKHKEFEELVANEIKNGAKELNQFPTVFEHPWTKDGQRAVITIPQWLKTLWFTNVEVNGTGFKAWTVHFSKEIELSSKAYRAKKMSIYNKCAEELKLAGLASVDAESKCSGLSCPPGTKLVGTMYWNPGVKGKNGSYSEPTWENTGKRRSQMSKKDYDYHMRCSYAKQKLGDDGDTILSQKFVDRSVPLFKVDAVGLPGSEWPFILFNGFELDFSKY